MSGRAVSGPVRFMHDSGLGSLIGICLFRLQMSCRLYGWLKTKIAFCESGRENGWHSRPVGICKIRNGCTFTIGEGLTLHLSSI